MTKIRNRSVCIWPSSFDHSFVIRQSCFSHSVLNRVATVAAEDSGLYNRAMLDIRLIREKPDLVRDRLATRGGGDEAKIDEVLRVDAERRKVETAVQQLNADRKRLSK